MGDNVELRLFSVAQIRDWLEHGGCYEGLSEQLIDKQRARAIVANPFVTDEMSLISALYVNGILGAYTCVFPDEMERPLGRRVFWETTLYVDPKYEGRGYAYIVIAQIGELYGEDLFDLDAAAATVENLKYQGLSVEYLSNYLFKNKHISRNSIKGCVAYAANAIRRKVRSKEKDAVKEIKSRKYSLEYVSQIDDETYAFIKAHSENDVFLRKRETFNWILQYPFMQESPLVGRCAKECVFSSTAATFGMYGIVVREKGRIVGFMVLRSTAKEWAVKYIYYEPSFRESVYWAVVEHLLAYPKRFFFTADKGLHDLVAGYRIYDHDTCYKRSFAYPPGFSYDREHSIQAGDGDNIT